MYSKYDESSLMITNQILKIFKYFLIFKKYVKPFSFEIDCSYIYLHKVCILLEHQKDALLQLFVYKPKHI